MFKYIYTIATLSFSTYGFAQISSPSPQTNGILSIQLPSSNQGNMLASAFEGQQFRVKSDMGVEGSPLLFDDWKAADVTLHNGERYHVAKVNFDVTDQKFIYEKNDTVYEFIDNLKEVRIYSEEHAASNTDLIFNPAINPVQQGFIQVLTSGKIVIVREYEKKPKGENYSNGMVNNTRKYVLKTSQSAIIDNKIIPVKYNRAALEELTAQKRKEIDAYVKGNKLNTKKENDFLSAIKYYNSIIQVSQ